MERDGEKFLTEVKGCTLADDLHPGIGLFPDAPTERGEKHLYELAKAFKAALVNAAKMGVQIICYNCHVEANSVKITSVVADIARFVNM